MTKIYFVRHVMSEGNLYHFWQGQQDLNITSAGAKQLELLERVCESLEFDQIYSSDLYRAKVTAESVRGSRDMKIIFDVRLREIFIGSEELEPIGNTRRDRPWITDSFNNDYMNFTCDGESMRDVSARMEEIIDEIALCHEGGSAAVVTHGGSIKAYLITHAVNAVPKLSSNASVTTVIYENGKVTVTDVNCEASVMSENPYESPAGQLYFRAADYNRDFEEIGECGTDSWYAIYGNINDFDKSAFMKNVKGILEADPLSGYFAYQGDNVAGLVLMDTRQQDEADVGHIALVYMKPDYRHKGYGAQLIGKALVFYRKKGMKALRLNVARCNKSAQAFYKKHGFELTPKSKHTLSRNLVMKKNIEVPGLQ